LCWSSEKKKGGILQTKFSRYRSGKKEGNHRKRIRHKSLIGKSANGRGEISGGKGKIDQEMSGAKIRTGKVG